MTPNSLRTGFWLRVNDTGLERYELLQSIDGWTLRGTILALATNGPAEARYEITCDQVWRTRRVEISLRDGAGERRLSLASENGRWSANGRPSEAMQGCVDVDLAWSPSTNTLPIRRLALAVGQTSGPITAAWVRFPELILEPLPQEYRRIAERRYRYSSRGGEFVADLTVDDDGLVLDYEGLWRRV